MAQSINIGRANTNAIVIDGTYLTVSNEHADITLNDHDELIFHDHSSNGTIINGQKIHNTTVQIFVGDEILLGEQCPLDWSEVQRFFPNLKRPTVAQKPTPQSARGTERFNPAESSTVRFNSNEPSDVAGTQNFNDPARTIANHPSGEVKAPKSISVKPLKVNKALLTQIGLGLIGTLIVAFLLLYFVFDDIWLTLI